MTMTHTQLTQPLRSAIDRDLAMRLAATEYGRFADLLRSLQDDDWAKPTACVPWDVRTMAAHALGMVEMAASLREQKRQNKAAAARLAANGGEFIDSLTALQVDERVNMTPAEIVARLAVRWPKAATGRKRAPGFVRKKTMPLQQLIGDQHESWTFGYLIDVVLTRDPWMHRIDIARATGAHHELTADHDGVLVADVVVEWAARHGQPYTLRLTGPAGGEWSDGDGGESIELDAIDFCATISGRRHGEGLLATAVPF